MLLALVSIILLRSELLTGYKFKKIFLDFHIPLPPLTRWLVAVSDWAEIYLGIVALILFVSVYIALSRQLGQVFAGRRLYARQLKSRVHANTWRFANLPSLQGLIEQAGTPAPPRWTPRQLIYSLPFIRTQEIYRSLADVCWASATRCGPAGRWIARCSGRPICPRRAGCAARSNAGGGASIAACRRT